MRPTKDRYYLMIAKEVARRATCFRNRLGAIIVKDDQVVATGYVGAPRKTKDCFERKKCLRDHLKISHGQIYELCRSVHAEQNAIINAARAGVSLLKGDIYIYGEKLNGEKIDAFPCFICKKEIINAGLKKVICSRENGQIKIFSVDQWVKDWQKKDVIDDKHQYGKSQNNKKRGRD